VSLAAIVDALAEAGCSAQQIAAAVRAHEQAAAPRSTAAERQARYRQRKAEGCSTGITGDVTRVTRDVTRDAEEAAKEGLPHTPSKKTTSLTNVREKSTRVRASEADFALVRNAYPKRIGGDPREPARKALDKALAGGASVEEIVDGARLFARFRAADDPKFTPMLATWLNRRGWADDYSEPPPRAGPLPRQSILAQIATGEIWHERDFNDIDIDSAGRAEPRDFGSGGADEEWPGAPGGPGKVLDFRRTGSGWG
jgi:hypothetical protein